MPGAVEDVRWVRLEDDSAIGAVRRFVVTTAQSLGFGEGRVGELAIAATELATNGVRHATAGSLLVRVRPDGSQPSVETIVIDCGPGMEDPQACFEDGQSSRGTLGIGLGAINRLANRFDVYSLVGKGTAMVAAFYDDKRAAAPALEVDGITRPITGEEVCGDAWAVQEGADRVSVVMLDGLGHGERAAEASRAALECFRADPWRGPAAHVEAAHRRLAGTRGAAMLALEFARSTSTVRYAGVGNIAGRVTGYDRSTSLPSQPGIVGHHMRRVQEFEIAVPEHSLIVLHSDGLTQKWEMSSFRGLATRPPSIVAAVLLREAGLHHDDASVVVLRVP